MKLQPVVVVCELPKWHGAAHVLGGNPDASFAMPFLLSNTKDSLHDSFHIHTVAAKCRDPHLEKNESKFESATALLEIDPTSSTNFQVLPPFSETQQGESTAKRV